MSQNGLNTLTLSSGAGAGPPSGSLGLLGHGAGNCSSGDMNHITSSQSWSHSQVGSSPNNGTGLAIGHHPPSADDFDARASIVVGGGVCHTPQSSSSSQTGTTLKEHDLFGMSEVSSSITMRQENSAARSSCGFRDDVELNLNLNIGPTELRLGPQESPRKQHVDSLRILEHVEGGAGRFYDGSGADADSPVIDRRSSTGDLGFRPDEEHQQQQQLMTHRNFSYSPLTIVEEESPLIDSVTLHRWQGGARMDRKMLANDGSRLHTGKNLGMLTHHDEMLERKMFLGSLDRAFEEALPRQQQLVSDGANRHHLATIYKDGPSWQDRMQDFSRHGERVTSSTQEAHAFERREDHDHQQEKLRVYESFPMENRGLASAGGEAFGGARQQYRAESRYIADFSSNAAVAASEGRSPRHPDYLVTPSPWQSQQLRSSDDFQTNLGQPVESCRNVMHGSQQPGTGIGFAGPKIALNTHPSKMGSIAGAKRSFDTAGIMSDTRNFTDGRGGGLMSSPGTAGNSTAIATATSAPCEADAKSKVQQQPASLYSSWNSKVPPTSWHAIQGGTGGSFGPFPSYQGPSPGPSGRAGTNTPSNVAVSGDLPRMAREAHGKVLQDPPSLGQKVFKESNSNGAAAPCSSPTTEVTSASRVEAKPVQAGSWPPLPKSRKEAKPLAPADSIRKPCPPPAPLPQAASPVSVASQPNKCLVKVYMDGMPIGRKVDLKSSAFCDYETLSVVLEDMFNSYLNGPASDSNGQNEPLFPSDKGRFLHGSDYVLTYEDREGDLMLVGDVPWTLFIDNVKRLRIMKGSEAVGIGSRVAEKNNKSRPTV